MWRIHLCLVSSCCCCCCCSHSLVAIYLRWARSLVLASILISCALVHSVAFGVMRFAVDSRHHNYYYFISAMELTALNVRKKKYQQTQYGNNVDDRNKNYSSHWGNVSCQHSCSPPSITRARATLTQVYPFHTHCLCQIGMPLKIKRFLHRGGSNCWPIGARARFPSASSTALNGVLLQHD